MAAKTASGFKSVATLPPTRLQRRLASAIVAVIAVAFALTIPFARVQLARVDSFLPTVESISSVTDLLTAILLFSQIPASRSRAVLVLASGYLFCAFLVFMHALSYPGAFAPTGVFGGPQAHPWLYTFWRVGFAAAVVGYASLKGGKDVAAKEIRAAPAVAIAWSLAIVLALVLAVAAAVTAGEQHLPVLVADPWRYSPLSLYVAAVMLALNILALVLLWSRQRSLLGLSLVVVSCAFVAEVALVAFFVTSRFSLGFYVSRAFSLATSVIVLALLVSESARLYARLARANLLLERERQTRLMNIEAATSAIVHEMRQPLTGISFNAGAARLFLGKNPPDHHGALSAVDAVIGDMQRASGILGGVRSLFGKATGQRERIDMNEVALDALRSLHAELEDHGVAVVSELSAELPPIYGDRGQLLEVMLNLVRNAMEAMQATADHRRLLRVVTQPHDRNTIAVTVADSGPGIDPDRLETIFDAFVTTKTQGTGLGLAICRTIVDRHGGELAASSGSDGALFRLILPITRTDTARAD